MNGWVILNVFLPSARNVVDDLCDALHRYFHPCRLIRLDFSLIIKAVGSPVPCKRLCYVPATYMPTAVWSVIRLLPDLS